ncbi:hypothetical protein CGCF415_v009535 [Colletotrichum fructicola]|nr:hypothetical protein CGCF415_v009535 [Colletotrichum fructicola]
MELFHSSSHRFSMMWTRKPGWRAATKVLNWPSTESYGTKASTPGLRSRAPKRSRSCGVLSRSPRRTALRMFSPSGEDPTAIPAISS